MKIQFDKRLSPLLWDAGLCVVRAFNGKDDTNERPVLHIDYFGVYECLMDVCTGDVFKGFLPEEAVLWCRDYLLAKYKERILIFFKEKKFSKLNKHEAGFWDSGDTFDCEKLWSFKDDVSNVLENTLCEGMVKSLSPIIWNDGEIVVRAYNWKGEAINWPPLLHVDCGTKAVFNVRDLKIIEGELPDWAERWCKKYFECESVSLRVMYETGNYLRLDKKEVKERSFDYATEEQMKLPLAHRIQAINDAWEAMFIEDVSESRPYVLQIRFRDGTSGEVDIKPIFKTEERFQPLIENPSIVKNVQNGKTSVFWDDMTDIACETLYRKVKHD